MAFPVELIIPAVIIFPAVKLPVAVIRPPVPMLPILALPDTLNVPVILAPVLVITNIFATPATLVVTFPFVPTISTLLVPFAIEETLISPALNVPVTDRLETVIVSVVLLKTKLALPLIAPWSLKRICVFEPHTVGKYVTVPSGSLTAIMPESDKNSVLFPDGGVDIVFAGSCFKIKLIFFPGVSSSFLPHITIIYHFFNLIVFTNIKITGNFECYKDVLPCNKAKIIGLYSPIIYFT